MSGYVQDMINSLKANNRRKNKHTPFSKNQKEYQKGTPLQSKELSPKEKQKLLLKLKLNRKREEKLRAYKMIISLGLTIVVIGTIVFAIQLIFF